MPWSLIGSNKGNVPDGSPGDPFNFTLACTGADLAVVFIGFYQGPGAPFPSVSDNVDGSTGWVAKATSDGAGGNRHLRCYYKFNPNSSTLTITITQNNPNNYCSAVGMSFSGSSGVFGAQVPASDGALGTVSGKDCTVADGSGVTTSENDMLLVAGVGSDGEYNKIFDPSGGSTWVNTGTNVAQQSVASTLGNHVGTAGSYRILSGGGSTQYGVKFNEPNFVANEGGISIMSFKMASAAAGIPNRALDVNQAIVRASVW